MRKIERGDCVRDEITGLKGTVIARTEWINGCARITIQPEGVKDGKPFEPSTVDEEQCVFLKRSKLNVVAFEYDTPELPKQRASGGPQNDAVALRR